VPGAVEYRLGDAVATRRARTTAAFGAGASLAPVLFAVVLAHRLGWGPNLAFWLVAAALIALVAVRAFVAYGALLRRLRTLVATVSDDAIRVATVRGASAVSRARVARIVDVEGVLGGIRVESVPDAVTGVVSIAQVPSGGVRFAEVRLRLASWRALERRGRRGDRGGHLLHALLARGLRRELAPPRRGARRRHVGRHASRDASPVSGILAQAVSNVL
jgi:hypothetical protein